MIIVSEHREDACLKEKQISCIGIAPTRLPGSHGGRSPEIALTLSREIFESTVMRHLSLFHSVGLNFHLDNRIFQINFPDRLPPDCIAELLGRSPASVPLADLLQGHIPTKIWKALCDYLASQARLTATKTVNGVRLELSIGSFVSQTEVEFERVKPYFRLAA